MITAVKVTLRSFSEKDIPVLQRQTYRDKSANEIRKIMADWNLKEFQAKYFEMFAVLAGDSTVGMISLYQHSKSVVSCGIEIFPEYRGQGFGKEAMALTLETAREKGYKIASNQVRTDNQPSIALHHALGFESDGYVYTNQKGRAVSIYLKPLTS
ncbi:MAG: GNAT family N-acetyltransferase [Lachnospiraceae bacterium]|jgi:RimJ/RimL family protein N-acetyltransferase|uniref:GNAT family N-acetyltransferase n=1 Tax=uncultured Acetatifactor sp. TaxID=1671927 RepID=UPI002620B490|nr:GNAT family N-acetyltransferase [uncultured Acetatifactor sp.]MCI8789167.1 GNAT family N-acetyltransferase [Lachnospiraceae bacterium]